MGVPSRPAPFRPDPSRPVPSRAVPSRPFRPKNETTIPRVRPSSLSAGLVPDIVTCNSAVSACEKGEQPERALEVFHGLRRQGVTPNAITYNALISAWVKGKQPEPALEVFIAT